MPLVLLHGAGGSYLQWPPDLRRLPTREVYALDLPGHGKSEGPVCTSLST
jgi:pimeloyl-ACP methyl ester carboxylesterase